MLFPAINCHHLERLNHYDISTGPNIALQRNATQGPDTMGIQFAKLAVDGNLDMLNNGKTCTHTTQGNASSPGWWRVDLGDSYRITGINIYNRDISK